MYGGPFPPIDIFSFLIPAALILGVVYIAIVLTQRRAPAATSPGGNGMGLNNSVLRILYTLAVAALVAAFVGFGIETIYPSPEYPEYPEEEFMFAPAEAQEPTPEMREAERRFQRETEVWEREFDAHNRIASVGAIGAAVLILVAGLLPAVGRLPAIGDGTTLGGVLTLAYGIILAMLTQSELLRFVAVTIGLAVLLAALYLKARASHRPPDPDGTATTS